MILLLAAFLIIPTFARANPQALSQSRDIVFDIDLPIEIDRAWQMWTTTTGLEAWLAPKAHLVSQVGGAFELFWDLAHPEQNSTLGCRILGLQENRLLSFDWRGPVAYSDIMNNLPFPTWVTVSFEKLSESGTLIHVRHSGWGSGTRWEAARDWQRNAWKMALAELQRSMGQPRSEGRSRP